MARGLSAQALYRQWGIAPRPETTSYASTYTPFGASCFEIDDANVFCEVFCICVPVVHIAIHEYGSWSIARLHVRAQDFSVARLSQRLAHA